MNFYVKAFESSRLTDISLQTDMTEIIYDAASIWVRHSGGPPFRRSAIPEVRHERMKWGIGVWLDWINCYFLTLYFMDFPPFLLL